MTFKTPITPRPVSRFLAPFPPVFDFVYGHASLEGDDYDEESGMPHSFYHEPKWMAVSLDLFGLDLSSI